MWGFCVCVVVVVVFTMRTVCSWCHKDSHSWHSKNLTVISWQFFHYLFLITISPNNAYLIARPECTISHLYRESFCKWLPWLKVYTVLNYIVNSSEVVIKDSFQDIFLVHKAWLANFLSVTLTGMSPKFYFTHL